MILALFALVAASNSFRVFISMPAAALITIRAVSDSGEGEQKVALTIEGDEAEFDAFSGHIRNNWFIYVIVLVNIVLIIAIILVIRSMVRPREVYE